MRLCTIMSICNIKIVCLTAAFPHKSRFYIFFLLHKLKTGHGGKIAVAG